MAGTPLPGIVGRDAENAELDAALADVAAGRFRCLPGSGSPRHSGCGPRRWTGSCGAAAGAGAGAVRSGRRAGVPAAQRRRAHRPARHRAFPGSAVAALAALVGALAAQRPLIVVADDLHLADPSSWAAMHHLAHDCADSPMLVVGTMRPIEAAKRPDVVEVLLRLEQDGVARRRTVPPLDPATQHCVSHGRNDHRRAAVGLGHRPPRTQPVPGEMYRPRTAALPRRPESKARGW